MSEAAADRVTSLQSLLQNLILQFAHHCGFISNPLLLAVVEKNTFLLLLLLLQRHGYSLDRTAPHI
jgi:hypothetical protein